MASRYTLTYTKRRPKASGRAILRRQWVARDAPKRGSGALRRSKAGATPTPRPPQPPLARGDRLARRPPPLYQVSGLMEMWPEKVAATSVSGENGRLW